MIVPGSNLLNMAFNLIAQQPFDYYRYEGRTTNSIKQYVANYADPVAVTGSVQPVARNLYQQLGLEWQKAYIIIYASRDILDVGRDDSGDQIEFENDRYNVLSIAPWFGIDGWAQALCVKVVS